MCTSDRFVFRLPMLFVQVFLNIDVSGAASGSRLVLITEQMLNPVFRVRLLIRDRLCMGL